ncbi:hypothetical protein ACIQK5_31525, partial [Streptomyces virginiae]|uniref:hypothetical protein n=1 Tax=Streptomyces virginiae TaxID=1961 RepID=UPI0037FBDF3D
MASVGCLQVEVFRRFTVAGGLPQGGKERQSTSYASIDGLPAKGFCLVAVASSMEIPGHDTQDVCVPRAPRGERSETFLVPGFGSQLHQSGQSKRIPGIGHLGRESLGGTPVTGLLPFHHEPERCICLAGFGQARCEGLGSLPIAGFFPPLQQRRHRTGVACFGSPFVQGLRTLLVASRRPQLGQPRQGIGV